MNQLAAREVCKRSQRGLFAGVKTVFGNNVSHSNRKTRRKWKPNVQNKSLWSFVLNDWIPLKVTAKALRCIDKTGGLDNYILKTKPEKLDSRKALQLKEQMRDALAAAPLNPTVPAVSVPRTSSFE